MTFLISLTVTETCWFKAAVLMLSTQKPVPRAWHSLHLGIGLLKATAL